MRAVSAFTFWLVLLFPLNWDSEVEQTPTLSIPRVTVLEVIPDFSTVLISVPAPDRDFIRLRARVVDGNHLEIRYGDAYRCSQPIRATAILHSEFDGDVLRIEVSR